jgi:hypothetical protein
MALGDYISNAPRKGNPKDFVKNFEMKRKFNVATFFKLDHGNPAEPEILKEIKSMSPQAVAERMQSDPDFAERCRKYRP